MKLFYIHTYIKYIHKLYMYIVRKIRKEKASFRRDTNHQPHWKLSDNRIQCSQQWKNLAKKKTVSVNVKIYMTSSPATRNNWEDIFNESTAQFGLMFLMIHSKYEDHKSWKFFVLLSCHDRWYRIVSVWHFWYYADACQIFLKKLSNTSGIILFT